MISARHDQNFQVSVGQTNSIQNKNDTEERNSSRLNQDSIKKLSHYSEKFSEWMICLYKDIIELKENMREIRQYQQTNNSQSMTFCGH